MHVQLYRKRTAVFYVYYIYIYIYIQHPRTYTHAHTLRNASRLVAAKEEAEIFLRELRH